MLVNHLSIIFFVSGKTWFYVHMRNSITKMILSSTNLQQPCFAQESSSSPLLKFHQSSDDLLKVYHFSCALLEFHNFYFPLCLDAHRFLTLSIYCYVLPQKLHFHWFALWKVHLWYTFSCRKFDVCKNLFLNIVIWQYLEYELTINTKIKLNEIFKVDYFVLCFSTLK